mgnify:CR=1 FL=1
MTACTVDIQTENGLPRRRYDVVQLIISSLQRVGRLVVPHAQAVVAGGDHGVNHLCHPFQVIGITGFDVHGQWHRNDPGNRLDGRDQALKGQGVAVRVTVGPGDSGAAGGDDGAAQARRLGYRGLGHSHAR